MRCRNRARNRHIFLVLAFFKGYDVICLNAGQLDILIKLHRVDGNRMRTLLLGLDLHPEGSNDKISLRTASEDIIYQKIHAFFFKGADKQNFTGERIFSSQAPLHGAVPRSGVCD